MTNQGAGIDSREPRPAMSCDCSECEVMVQQGFSEFILGDPKLKFGKTLATSHRYFENEKNCHQNHTILYNPTDRASNIAHDLEASLRSSENCRATSFGVAIPCLRFPLVQCWRMFDRVD